MSANRVRSLAALGAVAGLVVLGSGCGSDGGGSKAAKSQASTTSTGMTHGPDMASGAETTAGAAPYARLDPAGFATRMSDPGAVLINVHIPYEGELDHTNAFIPYDHIVGDARLPADKNAEVLLYCRSGRMSAIAGQALHDAGYTNLTHLEGGMAAWEAAGKTLLHNAAHAS